MRTLGLRPGGRLGLSPRRRRPLALPFSPDRLSDLAFWYEEGGPQNMSTGGAVQQVSDLSGDGRHGVQSRTAQADRLTTASRISAPGGEGYVVFRTPAARGEPRHFNDTDASTSVALGATKALSVADQRNLIDWAGLK